jgi:xanthine/CO dehydrogenase XdhC/CoxF family maturation factor
MAFAVLVETKGSTPQKCGAKAIFLPDGRVLGTLGGGCLEAETRQKALRALGRDAHTGHVTARDECDNSPWVCSSPRRGRGCS